MSFVVRNDIDFQWVHLAAGCTADLLCWFWTFDSWWICSRLLKSGSFHLIEFWTKTRFWGTWSTRCWTTAPFSWSSRWTMNRRPTAGGSKAHARGPDATRFNTINDIASECFMCRVWSRLIWDQTSAMEAKRRFLWAFFAWATWSDWFGVSESRGSRKQIKRESGNGWVLVISPCAYLVSEKVDFVSHKCAIFRGSSVMRDDIEFP